MIDIYKSNKEALLETTFSMSLLVSVILVLEVSDSCSVFLEKKFNIFLEVFLFISSALSLFLVGFFSFRRL